MLHAKFLCADRSNGATGTRVASVVGEPALPARHRLARPVHTHCLWFEGLEAEFAGADPAVLFTVAGVTAVHVGVRLSDLVQVALVVHALVELGPRLRLRRVAKPFGTAAAILVTLADIATVLADI